MYWAISDGGRQFESDMPAFKEILSQKDRWAVIAYVREGLPRSSP
jgi:mono/diheme cytochrome c family protein